jgi:putative transposase
MTIRPELLDELLKDYAKPEDLTGENGLLKQLTKALVERALDAEMDVHLDDPKYQSEGKAKRDRRNGHSNKTLKGEFGEAVIDIPRDRNGEFEPQIVKKGQTRFDGFDSKILSLYGRGMTTRDSQAQLKDMYGVEVSATLISQVTDAVLDEVKTWQCRCLSAVYPLMWFDAIVIKVRENGRVVNKAIHLVLALNLKGEKELLGMWITQNEGAKFWMSVLTQKQGSARLVCGLCRLELSGQRLCPGRFRADGVSRSHCCDLPPSLGAVVHGASGQEQCGVCLLQRPQSGLC